MDNSATVASSGINPYDESRGYPPNSHLDRHSMSKVHIPISERDISCCRYDPTCAKNLTSGFVCAQNRGERAMPHFARVLTIAEVAKILRLHPTTIYRLVKRGELPGFRVGDNWRINGDTLETWMSEKSRRPLDSPKNPN